jgi:hypothetical protein
LFQLKLTRAGAWVKRCPQGQRYPPAPTTF